MAVSVDCFKQWCSHGASISFDYRRRRIKCARGQFWKVGQPTCQARA